MTLCSMLKRTEVKGNLLPARWVTDTATISVEKENEDEMGATGI